jgi:hypothetical protein
MGGEWGGVGGGGGHEDEEGRQSLYIVIKSYTVQKETLYFFEKLDKFLILCCALKIKAR